MNKPLPAFLALLLLYGVVTFGALGTRDLWAPDEPRFAQIGREMLRSGDAIMPRMNGEPVALLPPLYYWVTAAAGFPAGDVTPAAARAGSALGGLLMLSAVFVLANAWRGPRAAFLSGLVLITSVKFWHQSIWSQVDLLVSGFVAWAITAFWLAYAGFMRSRDGTGVPTARPYISMRWTSLGFAFMALGTLTKGPLAVAAPGCVFFFLILIDKGWRFLRPGWILSGIALYAAVTVPWYVLACRAGGEAFTQEMVFKHNFGMFFDTWSHEQPFYYYLLNLPWMFFPWILFLPAAACALHPDFRGAALRGRPASSVPGDPGGSPLSTPSTIDTSHRCFLWIWFLSLFVFFSISEAKQHKYLLPAFPPLAILVGVWLDRAGGSSWVQVPLRFLAALGALVLVVSVVILAAPVELLSKSEEARGMIPALRIPAILLGVGLTAAWWGARALARRMSSDGPGTDNTKWPVAVAAGMVLAFLVASHGVFPALNPAKSARAFGERTRARMKPGDKVGIYGIQIRQIGAYVYYTDVRLQTFEDADERPDPAKLTAFWRMQSPADGAEKGRRFCFIQDEDFDKLPGDLRARMVRLDEESVGHRKLYLVATQE